jgi:two-component system, NtrC family, nitrogen regulation sensor histidine kinase NtrY
LLKTIKRYLYANGYLLIIAVSLFLLSFIIDWAFPTSHSIAGIRKAIEKDIKRQQADLNSLATKEELLKKLITRSYSNTELHDLVSKKYYLFIFPESRVSEPSAIFWNTQQVSPPLNYIYGKDSTLFVKLLNGYYILERKSFALTGIDYKIIGLIPVKWNYYINNNYLHNSFISVRNAEDKVDISTEPTKLAIQDVRGQPLFYLRTLNNNFPVYNSVFSILFKLVAALLFLIFLNNISHAIVLSKGLWKGFLFFTSALFILRSITYFFPLPLNIHQFALFSPRVYGSNKILRSLGDLFINTALFAWLIIFLRYHLKYTLRKPIIKYKYYWLALISIAIIFVTFICANLIRSLVADSQISFDVLNFFTLDIYTVIGFIILCCIAIAYFFLIGILLELFESVVRKYYEIAIPVSVLALIILLVMTGKESFNFFFFLMVWLLAFLFLMTLKELVSFTSKVLTSKLIFWLFFFSASITIAIVLQNRKKEIENRKHFAQNIANKMDPTGERMMSITLTEFRDDLIADIFGRLENKEENAYLKDSLINENFSGFLNKYETKIYSFDAKENILFNEDSTTYNTLNAIVETQSKPTSIPGLLYYDVSFDRFNYITRKKIIAREGSLLGYIFIISRPKAYKSDALYPQLFSKGSGASLENSPTYAYAVYINKQLVNTHNDYPFPTRLSNNNIHDEFYESLNNGYSELWYNADNNKIIVITKPDNFFIESVTLFAYIFCGFLLLIVIIRLLILIIKNRFNIKRITAAAPLTIRNEIQGTIIAISVFSFIIIGVTTILFFIARYNKNNRESLSKTINVMNNEIRNLLDTLPAASANSTASLYHKQLQEAVNKISEIHATDINIYDLKGNLQVSSLPLPYSKGILSTIIDPVAYYHLNNLKDAQYFMEQKVGELKYLNNYLPVRNERGKEYVYLNIPYFESQSKLEEEISNFLVTIINLNAFIFIIAGIIAFFITNRITRSFFFISDKMKEVSLGKANEVINWNRKDEIGELVTEYNKMVRKLDESAEKLARTEREGAWKEMARQVAHEIKNPLTPMKLNLQYLQMAIENKSPDINNMTLKVSKILVEQIDHLSKIASDFSQFANISYGNNEVLDLNDSVGQLIGLYSADPDIHLQFNPSDKQLLINGDKTHVYRLFTNLLENAVQSIPSAKRGEIIIETSITDGYAVITVKDNGMGIPDQMHDKIFIPNFTTKTSGTGLGLAMCKGIVEKMNGEIWFETNEGMGSTFFVKLPLQNRD